MLAAQLFLHATPAQATPDVLPAGEEVIEFVYDSVPDLGSGLHPTVQASAYQVTLQNYGNHEYEGPLFVGKSFEHLGVVYDTMSQWTIVINNQNNI